ncbi:MAG: tetratricopeptide repeat protein, partial [Leptospiraceae bacterium]|nr:tetratricopeptide repeat protein [Leptospiraceae bacterium]
MLANVNSRGLRNLHPLFLVFLFMALCPGLGANAVGSGGAPRSAMQADAAAQASLTEDEQTEPAAVFNQGAGEWFVPDFSRAELEATRQELDKSLVVTQLIHAFRFKAHTAVPGLMVRLEQLDPDSAELSYFKALLSYQNQKRGESLVWLDECLKRNPEYSRAWNLKGVIMSEASRKAEAVTAFQKALRWAPFNPVYLYNTASLHYRTGDLEEAEALIAQTLQAKVNLSEAYYLQALILRDRQKVAAAVESFAAANQYGQTGDQFTLQYAETALQAKSRQHQLELIPRLQRLADSRALLYLARIHHGFGEFQPAVRYYGQYLRTAAGTAADRKAWVQALAHTNPYGERSIEQLKVEAAEKESLLEF